jgi:membrane complex biogenesis BtpA family protein
MEPGGTCVIGMIHLQPLPGTPFHAPDSFQQILQTAVASAVALQDGGASGCLLQTVERVYGVEDESDPARTTAMGLIAHAVARATQDRGDFQIGVQLMRNAVSASLAVAKVAGGSFIRAGALVGMTLTAHGMVAPNPLKFAEYRRKIDAGNVGVVAEIDSMHFKWFGGGKSSGEIARAARNAGADAVTLGDPDEEATMRMIASVRAQAPGLPIILAGHTDHGNASRLLAAADGAFVGTCLEKDGWGSGIDVARVRAYMDAVRGSRGD